MDYDKLKQKKEQLEQAKPSIPLEKILQKQRQFEVEYAHNSTALAGNSLTLEQTRAVLDAVDPLKPVPQDGEDLPVSEEESPRRYPPPSPGTPPASGRFCGIAGGWCPAAAGTPGRRSAGFQSRTPRRFG